MALSVTNLDSSDNNIVEGLRNARLPGRMQRVSEQPLIIMDVAHNPHSAQYFATQLAKIKAQEGKHNVHAVVAMLHDKDIAATVAAMRSSVDYWYPASLKGPRAAVADEILLHLPPDCRGFECPTVAFDQALTQANADDIVIVFGSFYTVGQITTHLKL